MRLATTPPNEPTACGARVCAFKLLCAPLQTLFLPTYLTFPLFLSEMLVTPRSWSPTELLRCFGLPLFVCVGKLEAKVKFPTPHYFLLSLLRPVMFYY